MEHILYWLWLTGLFGVNSGKFLPMVERMGGIENFYKAKTYPPFSELTPRILKKLNNKNLDWAKNVYNICQKKQISIISIEDNNYPKALKHIFMPPVILYAKGIIPHWDELFMLSVVGTRRTTDYGINITEKLCTELSEKGVTIVSGFAKGIDIAATKSAFNSGAFSIVVLACGIDVNYPYGHGEIKKALLENGLILSEFPPGAPVFKWSFKPRNRIIAGLSRGVLITEAPNKSGALITAGSALDEGRDVFAVPGKIDDVTFSGINNLIKNGAKPVFSADDILDEYPGCPKGRMPLKKPSRIFEIKTLKQTQDEIRLMIKKEMQELDKEKNKKPKIKKRKKLPQKEKITSGEIYQEKKTSENTQTVNLPRSETEIKILKLLDERDFHIDELIRSIDAPLNTIQTSIFLLELNKVIKRLPGNILSRIK